MPCDLLIVALQCQQSKAENIFSKILDNLDISIFLAKSMYQRIKTYLQTLKRIGCISVPGVTFEDLASVKPSNANSSISEPFHREAQQSHHNTSHNLPMYFDVIYLRLVCLMIFLNGVFDYFCFIIILCHVCLLQNFKCFLLWCFESRLGLPPKEWTMPARIIEAKACACWIISCIKTSDVVFVYFSWFQFAHAKFKPFWIVLKHGSLHFTTLWPFEGNVQLWVAWTMSFQMLMWVGWPQDSLQLFHWQGLFIAFDSFISHCFLFNG